MSDDQIKSRPKLRMVMNVDSHLLQIKHESVYIISVLFRCQVTWQTKIDGLEW
jgi:hypothetical protein